MIGPRRVAPRNAHSKSTYKNVIAPLSMQHAARPDCEVRGRLRGLKCPGRFSPRALSILELESVIQSSDDSIPPYPYLCVKLR